MDTFRKYIKCDNEKVAAQPDWGINVLDVGHYIHPAKTPYPDTSHPVDYYFEWSNGRILQEYQLVYIATGSGVFETNAIGEVEVHPGTLFFLYPGTWHRFKPNENTGWTEYWVGFEGHYANHLMNQDCFNAEQPLLHMGFNTRFIDIFIQLIDTIKYNTVGGHPLAACLTIQLLGLVYASALMKSESNSPKIQLINNIKFSIHENLHRDISPEELAARHHVSYAWFRKAFKDVIGQSPGQYQLQLRLQKACRMLQETDFTISEIAIKNGFESEYYFSRIFKNKMLKSPSSYRKEQK